MCVCVCVCVCEREREREYVCVSVRERECVCVCVCCFLWFTGTLHRRNGFYTVQAVYAIALHLHYTYNLALTGDCAFLLSPKKTHSV